MEVCMSKIVLAGLAAVFIAVPSATYAQAPGGHARETLSEAVSKALIDRRVDVIKVALGLTPDQARLWPAVEEAIRARLTARHERLAKLAELRARAETTEMNPIELMLGRSDALAQRAAALKKLADAWQPL